MENTDIKEKVVELQRQMVVFTLDKEGYAVPIESVREVIKIPEITPVPQSPAFVSGIINLRGKVIAVVDLEARFGLNRENQDIEQDNIMILDMNESPFGVIVDKVKEVLHVPENAIKPAPSTIQSKIGAEFVQGVIVIENSEDSDKEEADSIENQDSNSRVLLVLDLAKVLTKIDQNNLGKVEIKEQVVVVDKEVIEEKAPKTPVVVKKKSVKKAIEPKVEPVPEQKVETKKEGVE